MTNPLYAEIGHTVNRCDNYNTNSVLLETSCRLEFGHQVQRPDNNSRIPPLKDDYEQSYLKIEFHFRFIKQGFKNHKSASL